MAWASCRAVLFVSILNSMCASGKLTAENAYLPGTVHACELYTATVNEIQNHTVGQLLNLNIRDVWCSEVAQVISLGTLGSTTALRWECAQNEEALGV